MQQRPFWNTVEQLWWVIFAKKVNSSKLLTLFGKNSTIDFWLSSRYDSWQYSQKKKSFKRNFPSYIKLFVSLFLLCIFYFVTQIRKACYRKKKIELLKSIYNRVTQFLILADWIIENDLCQILPVVLEFYVKQRGIFLGLLCPNLVK